MTEMDDLLRSWMAEPTPDLRPDFEDRLLGEIRRRKSKKLDGYSRILLAGYSVVSVVTSVFLIWA